MNLRLSMSTIFQFHTSDVSRVSLLGGIGKREGSLWDEMGMSHTRNQLRTRSLNSSLLLLDC